MTTAIAKPLSPLVRWQYEQIEAECVLLAGHATDPSCPCESDTEHCIRKHLLTIEALAKETYPMDISDQEKQEMADLADQARTWRKQIEQYTMSSSPQETENPSAPFRTEQLAEGEGQVRIYKEKGEFHASSFRTIKPDEQTLVLVGCPVDRASWQNQECICRDTGERGCTELHSITRFSQTKKNKIPAPFGWVGGKRLLSKKIVTLIPPHKTYVEPFCGAAWLFWAKEPSEVEVLNDLDPDLMRFFRDIGSIEHCDTKQISRDWDALKARKGKLEACEFLSTTLCSYGGRQEHKAKSGTGLKACENNAPRFHEYLPQHQARLKDVKLHNEDWRKVTLRYDSLETFFYFDPPYHGVRGLYKYGDDQLARLAETVPKLKGKWLLSYDNHPDVRKAFNKFNIKEVEFNYTLGKEKPELNKELLIANYLL